MLHCLRNDSYRKPSTKPVSSDADQGLHPLVVEPADSVTREPAVLPVEQDVESVSYTHLQRMKNSLLLMIWMN